MRDYVSFLPKIHELATWLSKGVEPHVDVISSRKIGRDAIVRGTSSKRRLISGKINNLRTEQFSLSLPLSFYATRENSLFLRLSPFNKVLTELYYKTNIFQVLWGITIVFWKGLPRRNGPRGETSIFGDHNDIDWYIISYNFSLLEILSAPRPEEREENAQKRGRGRRRKREEKKD